MVINLNPATSSTTHSSSASNETSNSSNNHASNIMGIITHTAFDGIVYLQVVCAGDEFSKWVTVEEAMDYCPSGVIAYTKLQLNYIYGVPLDWLFPTN